MLQTAPGNFSLDYYLPRQRNPCGCGGPHANPCGSMRAPLADDVAHPNRRPFIQGLLAGVLTGLVAGYAFRKQIAKALAEA